jgi:diguanylate cyclase (GGDEF)-like protein
MEAASFADKLRTGVESIRVAFEDKLISMTVSGGISPAIQDGSPEKSLEQVLSRADRALYKAKSIGRNRVCIMNPADNNENLIEPASRYSQS